MNNFINRLLFSKKKELGDARDKLRNGLSKIDDTREKVEKMSIELEDAKTKVAQFQKQCDEYLVVIVHQKREADEQQKVRSLLVNPLTPTDHFGLIQNNEWKSSLVTQC